MRIGLPLRTAISTAGSITFEARRLSLSTCSAHWGSGGHGLGMRGVRFSGTFAAFSLSTPRTATPWR